MTTKKPTARAKRSKRILVVEDEKALRDLYAAWLSAKGYEVDVADNGVTAVEKALDGKPDLVLLDVLLPKKDGFEVLTEIRRNPKTRNMPVIILSSLDQEFEQRQGLNLGAAMYLVKTTLSPDVLYQAVDRTLT